MTAMNDDDLAQLLKELPRRGASTGFTDRVLERVDHRAPTRSTSRVVWASVAAAVLVAAIVGGYALVREREEQRAAERRLEEMRREYRALHLELEELRMLTSEVEPVLDLGGTDQVEFIFDLREFTSRRGASRAEPASHSTR